MPRLPIRFRFSAAEIMSFSLAGLFALIALSAADDPRPYSAKPAYEQNRNIVAARLRSTYQDLEHRGRMQMLSAHDFHPYQIEPDFTRMGKARRAEIAATIGEQHGVPGHLFAALVMTESGFDPSARSHVGAIGLAQLMPATAQELGVDPYDPWQNLTGGARYLRAQYDRFGDWQLALAAYNAGPTRVARLGRIPRIRETQNYVTTVLRRAENFRGTV